MSTRSLFLATLAVVLTGCNGGTVDRHALTNDSAALDSIACEGALLAHMVTKGKTTAFFVREQAEELQIESANFADALAKRKTEGAIESRVRRKARHAALLAATLKRLHDRPSDRSAAGTVERRLKQLGGCP